MTSYAVAGGQTTTDSLYLFSYSRADGRSGLRLAWSENGKEWNSLCDPDDEAKTGYNFVSSDFGPWGSHKTMFDPRLYKTAEGWAAVWYVSPQKETIAYASSPDLIKWRPQKYETVEDSCKLGLCGLSGGKETKAEIGRKAYSGYVNKVHRSVVSALSDYMSQRSVQKRLEGELMKDDPSRFANLRRIDAKISFKENVVPLKISDRLIGIFFEDISYAADGGLYAELVQNRDFEYDFSENHKKGWGPSYAWILRDAGGNKIPMNFSQEYPLHENNSHYLAINGKHPGFFLVNKGFDGISLKKGETYCFSMYVRNNDKSSRQTFDVSLVSGQGKVVGTEKVTVKAGGWRQVETELKADATVSGASLVIGIPANSSCDMDMISLFPQNTFKGRRNGLRKDLAETLAALNPKFVRFPGGCVTHGDGIDNIYDWKGSIGALEARKPLRNIWNYHQSRGLGYHEYFLLCEDLGAEPLPVIAAGVPCQNSGRPHSESHNEITSMGQQCGIPMERMEAYVQDILDLIEYANGDPDTEWGARRAAAGHPEPFDLKYLGIGNEDMITDVFEERFKYIHDVLKVRHPEIVVVGTAGPFFEGSDYEEGWRFARQEQVWMVDEHYYVSPGWFINNRNYYDSYDREGPKVYLGEYASHMPDRKNTLEAALTVALYLTDVERNGDVVAMTSYAPLLAKQGHENWRPDLIFFDNDSISLTPDYYVQQLYGQNSGTEYVAADVCLSTDDENAGKRFGHSLVIDEKTGDIIVKIANLLPVKVSVDEDLSVFEVGDQDCVMTVLTGNPGDECTKPDLKTVSIKKGKLMFEAAPYSFNVVRICRYSI